MYIAHVLVCLHFADGVGDVLEDVTTFQLGLVARLLDRLPPTNVVHELMEPGIPREHRVTRDAN